jgi:hypothetical protein
MSICRIGDDLDAQLPRPGAVKLSEEDTLPLAERGPTVFNPDRFGRADERGLDMRIRIPFRVPKQGAIGNQPVERAFHISRHVRVIALIDQNARRRVRNIEVAHAEDATRFADGRFDLVRDVLELGPTRSADRQNMNLRSGFHHLGREHELIEGNTAEGSLLPPSA